MEEVAWGVFKMTLEEDAPWKWGSNGPPSHMDNVPSQGGVENPGISYSDIPILIPDSRTVYDPIFTLFILLTLSR